LAGDEPRAASAGDENRDLSWYRGQNRVHRPSHEDEDAVLQPDEVEQVHDEVPEPGESPAQLNASDVQHRPTPADGRDVALVDVSEWPALATVEPGSNDLRCVAALLHGDGGQARQRRYPPVGVLDLDHVSEREDLGVAGKGEVGLDNDPAGAVDARAGGLRERPREARGAHARGPDRRLRGDPLERGIAALDGDGSRIEVHD
jgi:hypothetical protein